MADSDAEEEQDKSKRVFDPESVPAMKNDFKEQQEMCMVDLIGDVEANTSYRIMEYENVVPIGIVLYVHF